MISAVSNNTQKQSFGAFFINKPEITRIGEMEVKQFKNRAGVVRKIITTNIDGSIFKSFRSKNGKPVKTTFWSKIGNEVKKIVTTFNQESGIATRITKVNGKTTEIEFISNK